MKKVLFYPATFNPPHLGHASMVLAALDVVDFDEVWIMPGGKRVDKEISTSFEDIKKLATLFVEYLESKTHVTVKLITTAVDNLDKDTYEHMKEFRLNVKEEMYQLLGIDGYLSIKEGVIGPEERFIINKRLGYEIPESLHLNPNIFFVEEDINISGISSTQIRGMVKGGNNDYRKLVPEKVSILIEENNLYLN